MPTHKNKSIIAALAVVQPERFYSAAYAQSVRAQMKFTVLFIATVLLFGCSEKGLKQRGFERLGELKKENGTYLGTLLGVRNSKGLFSEIVVQKSDATTDILYRIDSVGFHNSKELETRIATGDYDGWNIQSSDRDQFDVWLVKIDGSASDGATIQWVDSLQSFAVQYAP
ncbi:MAG: hypothetical protein KIT50_13495 [Bacteroidetes bacterium]|nr:hypothetical protein [Bacteroidota bacterium]